MRNFQDGFETPFISVFSICMTVPLRNRLKKLYVKVTFQNKINAVNLFVTQ